MMCTDSDMWHVHDSKACTQDKPILQLKPEDSVGPAGGDSPILCEPHKSSSRERETTSIRQHKEGFQISCRETPSLLLLPGPGPARSGRWPSFVNRIQESEHCPAKRQEEVVNMHTMCKGCQPDDVGSDMVGSSTGGCGLCTNFRSTCKCEVRTLTLKPWLTASEGRGPGAAPRRLCSWRRRG